MTLFAFLLVSGSAVTHALWNFIGKRQNPPAAFFLMASIATVVMFSPVLIIFHAGLPVIPIEVWGLIAATGACQAVYYICLAAAYRTGDLSHVYPMARSLPVVLVALVSLFLGRGSQIHPWAYAGFFVVTTGCMLLPLPGFRSINPGNYRQKWILFALLAAICITGYTLLDDQALRMLRSVTHPPLSDLGWALLYGELETISISLFLTMFLFCWKSERMTFLESPFPVWRTAAWMGLIINLTYLLVLLAMAYVSNVSYVMAFRQMSIPIGAALGLLVRRESWSRPKLAGIGLVLLGLVLVALG